MVINGSLFPIKNSLLTASKEAITIAWADALACYKYNSTHGFEFAANENKRDANFYAFLLNYKA